MARLFGTDGVRGVANADLSCELALNIGRAAAYEVAGASDHRAKILIGKDTRKSSDMLENALAAGICSVGADCVLLGVVPTPAVAYLTRLYDADAGIVISASHNPMEFNGIKIFNGEGFKLDDAIEDNIERLVKEGLPEGCLKTHGDIGTVSEEPNAVDDYVDYLASCVDADLSGMKIAVDCANGASVEPAMKLFPRLGAECIFTAVEPDGSNVNDGVGSTHLVNIKKVTVENGCDLGLAFDGDADRCLAVDENGEEIDGDKMIAIFARFMKDEGRLKGNTAVVTVMTNMGFMDYCERYGIEARRTAVGDRYVLELMRAEGYSIGGEQSGHIIMLDHSTTGDGELTGAILVKTLKRSGGKASELASDLQRYPQVLMNVKTDVEGKAFFRDDDVIQGYIESQQQELFGEGRVLVRLSGTEPLIRVMVEGKDEAKIMKVANDIVARIRQRIRTL